MHYFLIVCLFEKKIYKEIKVLAIPIDLILILKLL